MINVSEKYNCIWIAPEKTGTKTLTQILTFCGFTYLGLPTFQYGHHHYTHAFPEKKDLEKYDVFINTRNPYGRAYSVFEYFIKAKYKNRTEEITFEKFIKNIEAEDSLNFFIGHILDKPPKYFCRMEHLKEDLMKIPFIVDNVSEKRLDLLLIHPKEIVNWEPYYTPELKEIVYNLTKPTFEMFGYQK